MGAATLARLGDYSLPWYQLRGSGNTLVSSDDTPLALATAQGDWADKPAAPSQDADGNYVCTAACAVNVPQTCGGRIRTLEIIGYGTNAANETCDWILYAYRGPYSPVRRIATGTAILGTMDCPTDPVQNAAITDGYFVDTWGTTTDYWESVSEIDDAANGCSALVLDLRGYTYLYMEIDIPAANQVASFGAAFSGV